MRVKKFSRLIEKEAIKSIKVNNVYKLYDKRVYKMVTNYTDYLWTKKNPRMTSLWGLWPIKNIIQLKTIVQNNHLGLCFSTLDRKEFQSIKSIVNSLSEILDNELLPKIILIGFNSHQRDKFIIASNLDPDLAQDGGDLSVIPDELVTTIFSYLDILDLYNVIATCKRYFLLILKSWGSIDLSQLKDHIVTDTDIKQLQQDLNAIFCESDAKSIYTELKQNTHPLNRINIGPFLS